MKRAMVLLAVLCLMLCGCSSWMNGSYSAVVPHTEPSYKEESEIISVANYQQLKEALISTVISGKESAVLSIDYPSEGIAQVHVDQIIHDICQNNPFAAYAVEQINCEFGTNGGQNAVGVRISYLQNRVSPDKIQRVENKAQVEQIVGAQLDDCASGVVLYLANPAQVDYAQMVEDYARQNPQKVMEIPEVTVSLYPEHGNEQVVALKFSYQTSREELRIMQNKVTPVFLSATQYVSSEEKEEEKAARLYTFLMERYSYNIQTSITPAYSLLLHGVGDSRAFATVYAAMCRQAGLECRVVTGTRQGQPWQWNAIQMNGTYYYLDLLRCSEGEGFALRTENEMEDYVWDYSDYQISQEENS